MADIFEKPLYQRVINDFVQVQIFASFESVPGYIVNESKCFSFYSVVSDQENSFIWFKLAKPLYMSC